MSKVHDPELQRELIEILNRIDFGHRYYERCASLRERSGYREHRADRAEIEALLAKTGLAFRHSAREKFFQHTEAWANYETNLRVSFRNSVAEFILYVSTDDLVAGGPYPRLALQAIQAREPDFNPTPLAPKLPFSNAAKLWECVGFGVTLFNEVRTEFTKQSRE
ncbi:hypothetical protein ABGB16_10205 [Micromonospora sp. B11E3]|uniref:hypothetical protein n=1 Tax=Micromonospora sp. B11E3 TaxID=3153562 RepID=UPI00325DAE6A